MGLGRSIGSSNNVIDFRATSHSYSLAHRFRRAMYSGYGGSLCEPSQRRGFFHAPDGPIRRSARGPHASPRKAEAIVAALRNRVPGPRPRIQ
jgi:hypothetical protein